MAEISQSVFERAKKIGDTAPSFASLAGAQQFRKKIDIAMQQEFQEDAQLRFEEFWDEGGAEMLSAVIFETAVQQVAERYGMEVNESTFPQLLAKRAEINVEIDYIENALRQNWQGIGSRPGYAQKRFENDREKAKFARALTVAAICTLTHPDQAAQMLYPLEHDDHQNRMIAPTDLIAAIESRRRSAA